VPICFSEEINCKTLETRDGTLYIVPDFTGSDCHYSWSNSSGHVLANNDGGIDIIGSNSTSLHTNSCYETVEYSRGCMSEQSKTVKCFANCTRSERLPNVEELPTKPNTLLGVSLFVAFMVLVVGGILMGFVFRDKLSRCRKHLYTAVKPNKHRNQVADVMV
ncbi:hypothetical protein ILYODFUR_019705, partial [Ilyodon furcidens]